MDMQVWLWQNRVLWAYAQEEHSWIICQEAPSAKLFVSTIWLLVWMRRNSTMSLLVFGWASLGFVTKTSQWCGFLLFLFSFRDYRVTRALKLSTFLILNITLSILDNIKDGRDLREYNCSSVSGIMALAKSFPLFLIWISFSPRFQQNGCPQAPRKILWPQ